MQIEKFWGFSEGCFNDTVHLRIHIHGDKDDSIDEL